MTKDNYLAHAIEQTNSKPAYDAACKKFLACKPILAWIMKCCVKEFSACSIEDIVEKYIEGEPAVGSVGVHPDDTVPSIRGLNTEDKTLTEGTVFYDIRFFAIAPDTQERIRLILNIEAQKDYNPGYPLLKRAVYYGARLISSQYGTEFQNSNYQDIKKVYSIWVCTNVPQSRKNTINHYALKEHHIAGRAKERPEDYDLLHIVIMGLSSKASRRANKVLQLLSTIFLQPGNAQFKKRFLQEHFGIEMTTSLEEEVDTMCNLSEGIEERGIEKGIKQGMEQGMEKGMEKGIEKGMAESRMETAVELMKEKFPMEKISRITRLSMEKLQELGKMNGLL